MACHRESQWQPDSEVAPAGSRHWHTDSCDCSGSIWVDCGVDEYMNAAGADTVVAS